MWSLATRSPNRLVMPLSSGFSSVRLRRRRDLDLAGDDVLPQLLDLGLQRGVHLVLELVVRSEERALVVERAQERAALLTVLGTQHGLLHRVRDVLHDAGEEHAAVVRRALTSVEVHPDRGELAVRRLRRGGGAQTRTTRDREDDVGALRLEVLREGLSLVLVCEALGERPVLALLVPAEHLDLLLLDLVVVLQSLIHV